jgi:hypothetical protein
VMSRISRLRCVAMVSLGMLRFLEASFNKITFSGGMKNT